MEEVLQNLNRGIQGLRLADRQQSLLSIDKFDGKGPARAWLETFVEAAAYAHTNEADKIRLFPLLLKGSALVWFRTLTDAQKADWDTLTGHFEDRFLQDEGQQALRQISKLEAKKNEKMAEYAARCQELFEKTETNEDQKLHYFLEGLPHTIKRLVIMHEPADLDAAVALAKRAEKAGSHEENAETNLSHLVANLTAQVSELSQNMKPANNRGRQNPRGRAYANNQDRYYANNQDRYHANNRGRYRSNRDYSNDRRANYSPTRGRGRQRYYPSRTSPVDYNWRDRRHSRSPSPQPGARRSGRGNWRGSGRFNTFHNGKSATFYNFNTSPPYPDKAGSPSHVAHHIHQNKWIYCRLPDNRHVKVLLDTGAKFSAISEKLFQQIYNNNQVHFQKPDYEGIVTATGGTTKIPGKIQTTLKIDGIKYPCDLHVVPNLTTPLILGECFFEHYNTHILYDRQQIFFDTTKDC